MTTFISKEEFDRRRLAKLNEEEMIQVGNSKVSITMMRRVRALNAAGMGREKIGKDIGLPVSAVTKILNMDPPPRKERL